MFGIIGLVFLAATAITWLATVRLIQAEYVKIEVENVQKDTARSVDALGSRVDQLALKIPDWSSWDDTYQFIADHNVAYLESNVQNSALQNLTINFMLFFNAKQQLVNSVGVDIDSGDTIPIPPELTKALAPGSKLLAATPDDQQRGILRTSKDPIIVVTRPILRTDGTGPVRGTLVFAQYLSPAGVAKIGEITHLKVAYDPATLDGSMLAPVAAGTSDKTARTETKGSNIISGYQLINDIYGRPVLVAHVEEPRSIFLETQRTLLFYMLVVLGVTLAAVITAMLMTNKIVRQDRTIKLKNEFFSIASHELRTPLWTILGNISVIKERFGPKNEAKLTELASGIHEEAARLIKIVSNFLDAARLERGKMPLKLETIDIQVPINAVVEQMQTMAGEKQLFVRYEPASSLLHVRADSERVQQVIYNLVGNAMKYTDHGGITITAGIEGTRVVVSVIDTGRGIAPSGQQALFKSFQQTQAGEEAPSSGLGLYICKMLIERMGGKIWLKSTVEDKGTTMAFSLPIAAEQKLPGSEPPAPIQPAPGTPPPKADTAAVPAAAPAAPASATSAPAPKPEAKADPKPPAKPESKPAPPKTDVKPTADPKPAADSSAPPPAH